jgi:phospholipid/cholesterol/gamma-HCH transport system substrate-binding protein
MENRSHALAAGIFTVLLTIGIIAAAMWLNRDTQQRTPYVLITTGSVAGLNPQAAVRYRGMEVGKVEAIEFDREQPGRILVKVGILPTTPVTTATFAELGMQGLTGLAYIQLDTDPKIKNPALLPSTVEAPARMAIRPSLFDRFSISGEDLIISASTAMNRVNKLLGDDNQKLLVQTLANFQGIADRVGQLADEVKPAAVAVSGLATDGRKVLAGITPVLQSADETLVSFGKLSTELSRRMDAVDRAARGAEQVGQGAEQIARSVAAIETQTGPRLNALIEDAGRGARTLERVAERLGDEPTSVLFGLQPARPGPGEAGFVAPIGGAK